MGFFKRMVVIGGGSGLVLGGGAGVVYYRRLQENKSVTGEAYNDMQNQEELKACIESLKYGSKTDSKTGAPLATPLQLYRYTTCPFCGKAKALLDLHQVNHECVEVEPMFKSQIADSKYKKVPQLQFQNGKSNPYLVDSDIIVDKLGAALGHEKEIADPDVQKWREWARASLVRHIVLNINGSLKDAWEGYEYIDQFDSIPQFNKTFLKVMGAPVMFCVSKYMTTPTLKKRGELKDGDDVAQVLRAQVDKFVAEGLTKTDSKKPFHGGSIPDLADIDVYGVFQSIRGHRVYNDILDNTKIKPWIAAMDQATRKADALKL